MRRFLVTIFVAGLAFLTTSCGENKSTVAGSTQTIAPQQQNRSAVTSNAGSSSDGVIPPQGAQWTIYCATFAGPGHIERSKQLKDGLKSKAGLDGWYVVSTEQQSTLYYGYYRSSNDPRDPKESNRIRADREKVASIKDSVGNYLFRDALPVLIAAPDPVAPPEYNLENARGYWSLQIAAYQGAGRKEAAIQAVKEARKLGIEAYYHHGADISEVCIGSWPEEAVKKQDTDSARSIDPAASLLVIGPGAHLPESMTKNAVAPGTNRPMRVLEQKVEVVDPTMLAAMRQFPNHALNGVDEYIQARDPNTQKIISAPKSSTLVLIPQRAPTLLQPDAGMNQPFLSNPQPAMPGQSGMGRLP